MASREANKAEANKADKRRRIRLAAKSLFSSLGYDATTMRDIAKHAGVGVGTLSLYAEDKRDLILLIFNEMVPVMNARAEEVSRELGDLVDKLMRVFTIYVENAAADRTFARIRYQLSYFSDGRLAKEYYAHRQRHLDIIEGLIREALAEGRISTAKDPAFIARQLFFSYSANLRWWVGSESTNVEDCLRDLREAIELQVEGMTPAKAVTRSPSRSLRS